MPINYAGLTIALFLPWILGYVWVRVLWAWRPENSSLGTISSQATSPKYLLSIHLGYGYFLGILATTILMRVWDAAGFTQSFVSLSLILSCLTGIGIYLQSKKGGIKSLFSKIVAHRRKNIQTNYGNKENEERAEPRNNPKIKSCSVIGTGRQHDLQRFAFWLLFVYIVTHLVFYGLETIWRPLYPWDAWMNWAPKVRVWFELKELVPFTSPELWLNGESLKGAYTLGHKETWRYPPTVPLIQLWTALGINAWEESLMNLPWLICPISLALGLYGHVRMLGMGPIVALIFAYLLISLPFVGVHIALAGYAEPWLAACYGLASMALIHWARTRDVHYALLAILLAVACSQLKIPGIVWMFSFFPALLLMQIRPRWLWLVTILLGFSIGVLFILGGVEVHVPNLGSLILSQDKIQVPGIGTFEIQYHDVWRAFIESYFVLSSWSLFWYLSLPSLVAFVVVGRWDRAKVVAVSIVVMAFVFIFIVFFFTRNFRYALDYSTINRATYHMVPFLIFVVAMFFSNIKNCKLLQNARN